MVDDNRLRSTNVTFESKVKVACTKNLFNGLQLVLFMGVYIWHNDCQQCVDDNRNVGSPM